MFLGCRIQWLQNRLFIGRHIERERKDCQRDMAKNRTVATYGSKGLVMKLLTFADPGQSQDSVKVNMVEALCTKGRDGD